MKIKSFLAKPFASYIYKQIKKEMVNAVEDQQAIFNQLIKVGAKTEFGKDHGFDTIKTYEDFVQQVPVRDYEAFKVYIEKIKEGKHNVLWKGQPIYFAKNWGKKRTNHFLKNSNKTFWKTHWARTTGRRDRQAPPGPERPKVQFKMIKLRTRPLLLSAHV